MTDFPVTIYHNPNCGTSRNVLAMIRAAGVMPVVVEYVKDGWDKPMLAALLHAAGLTARQALRTKGELAASLGLLDEGVADEAILEAMIAHPVLVERPFVVTPKGVKLCRPSEVVFTLLEQVPESFTKEDGEMVRGAGGKA